MSRLRSREKLGNMSHSNRWTLLFVLSRDAQAEIAGLKDGSISAPPGALKNARRRFERILATSAHFGDYIDFRGKPRVRVRAISRPLAA